MNFSIQLRKGLNKASKIVSFSDDKVIKSLPETECLLEAWKSQIGKEIGSHSDTFYTPSILEIHKDSIVFEKVNTLTSMRHMLSIQDNRYLAKSTGTALANIHAYDISTARHHSDIPDAVATALSGKILIHGDFNTYNIQYDNTEKKLCIIDWAPPSWAKKHKCTQSHYFDISVFIISVFSRRPLEPKTIPDPDKVIDDFLFSYQVSAINKISPQLLYENLNEVIPIFTSSGRTFFEKLAKLSRRKSFKKALRYCKNLEKRGILAT